MEKYYKYAGVELAINIPDDRMYQEERHLSAFKEESVDNPHRFSFEIVEALEPPAGEEIASFPSYRVYDDGERRLRYIGSVSQGWDQAYIRVENHGLVNNVQLLARQFPGHIGVKTVLSAVGSVHLVAEAGGFILHSSFIEWNEKAILFTAPSGTGKSTQADLWREHRGAEIINGDRSAIRLIDGKYYVSGIPYAGSSEYCKNRTLPLGAIVYLKQAPKTTISRLSGIRAFRNIWEGVSVSTWNKEDVSRVSEMVMQIVSQVPVYQLSCTPDISAVQALEECL